MKKITKAVIPAAGLGTRMLPIARTVPKEVLPIVDRPVMDYLVREAADSGITDILIITNRGKGAIEDYFDYSPEYEQKLIEKGKTKELEQLRELVQRVNVHFIRQKEPRGLGHAISCARAFTGDEAFCVLYGDDVVYSDVPVCRQMMDAYEKYGLAVAAVQPVTDEQIVKYCSLDVEHIEGREYHVKDMIEKPKPEEKFSNLSILGRVLLTADIYDILDNTAPGAGNEIQLTDAMKELARTKGMSAVEFIGKRYDMGSKMGFLEANIEYALRDPALGEDFRAYLKEKAATL
ncbi:MAG: UTP--glucose-1-phosphate uridylyltransferase [Clostridia bacterium]|nr:UTP--glucose-1-phosphate uridylyltransferase [Clostridia bacterium]